MLKKKRKQKTKITFKLGPTIVITPIKISLVINLIILILTSAVYPFIQPVVPLFYSLSDPSKHLANKSWLFILPIISIMINLIHIYSLKIVKEDNQFIIKLFIYSGLTLQIVLLLISLRNIFIIFKIF